MALHSGRLERYLGPDQIAHLQQNMRGWHGPAVQVALPGRNNVQIHADGGFSGTMESGFFASMVDEAVERATKHLNRERLRWRRAAHQYMNPAPMEARAGFSSFADFLAENKIAKKDRVYGFSKVGTAGQLGAPESLWRVGNFPAAAGAPSNAPGGDALSSASAGALNQNYDNSISGDTEHYYRALLSCSAANNFSLLLYDRLFQVNKTMNSTATEAVSGVPTRYTSTTQGAQDSIEGNFLFIETQTVLAATAHNWTVCQYTNQAGTTAQTLPTVTGTSGQVVNAFDMPIGTWFCPLANGDTGVKALSQMQCSAAVATGAIAFVIGHTIAWIPCLLGVVMHIVSEANYALNFCRIFDSSCLALIEPCKQAANALTWNGAIHTVRG